jgi:hypothetical protein
VGKEGVDAARRSAQAGSPVARILALVGAVVAVALVPSSATGRVAESCNEKVDWNPTTGITATSADVSFGMTTWDCDAVMQMSWTTVVNGTKYGAGTEQAYVRWPFRGGFTVTIGPLFPGATYDVTLRIGFSNTAARMSAQATLTQQVTTLSRLSVYRSVGGAVRSASGTIACGDACVEEAAAGTSSTLTATADRGFRFSHWEGACQGTAPACTVAIAGDLQASAFFTPARTLSVSVGGSGAGSVTSAPAGISCAAACSAVFDAGASVTLRADPDAGSVFAGWTGGGCGDAPVCVVSLANDVAVAAAFTKLDVLSVQKRGKGVGTVTGDPGGIACGTSCSARLERGTTVTLVARPARRSRFAGWSGACAGTRLVCVVELSGDATSTATFALKPKPKPKPKKRL